MRSVCLLALAAGCVVARREVAVPPPGEPAALVGSAALVHPLNDLARHPWVALRNRDGSWERWEVMCCPEDGGEMGTVRQSSIDPLDDHGGGGGDVRIHGVWRGAEAERIAACVRREAPAYPHRSSYHAWPGPNSNTFVDWLLRRCSMHVDLPGPNIGKDYRGLVVGVSTTSGGTGVQLETPLAGLKLGLTEGVEVHILGLALGVDLWPPAHRAARPRPHRLRRSVSRQAGRPELSRPRSLVLRLLSYVSSFPSCGTSRQTPPSTSRNLPSGYDGGGAPPDIRQTSRESSIRPQARVGSRRCSHTCPGALPWWLRSQLAEHAPTM